MKVSKQGRDEIADHEGIVLRPYKDTVGVWTIGVGHTRSAGLPDPAKMGTITRAEAMAIFSQDLAKFEGRVLKAFTSKLTQAQFDAAVSFDFNTGRIHDATWVKLFNRADVAGARKSFMAWRKPPEIIGRRKKEQKLFFDGVYSSTGDGVQRKPLQSKPKTPDPLVSEAQKILTSKGFNPGAIDGWMGKNTQTAILAYQKQHPDLDNDGILGPATMAQLRRDANMLKNVTGDILKKVAPTVGGAGGAAWYNDISMQWIYAGVGVIFVSGLIYIGWKYRDVIARRFNGMFGRTVR